MLLHAIAARDVSVSHLLNVYTPRIGGETVPPRDRKSDGLTRAELNLSLRQKMKKKAREMQEELAMDMKLLQEMLQQTSNEDAERQQRKVIEMNK